MNQAIRIISKEFGSDAVLLDVKRVRKKGLANYFKKTAL
jgi:flagellar biosynthesis GTPase FlhF